MKKEIKYDYAILIPCLSRGGAELQCIALANDLVRLRKKVILISFKKVENDILPKINKKIKLYELNKKKGKIMEIFKLIFSLYRLLKVFNPSKLILFLSYSEKIYIILRFLGLKINAITFIRSGINIPSPLHSFYGKYLGSIFEEIYINSVVNFFPALKFYSRIPIFFPNYLHLPSSINKCNFKKSEIKIIYIARYIVSKNHKFLFESLLVNSNLKNIKIYLLGDSNKKNLSYIYDLIQKYGLEEKVCINFNVDDVYSLLREMNVMVFCSNYTEGHPNALLEGMACGLNILCSNKYSDLGMPINYYKDDCTKSFNDELDAIINENRIINYQNYLDYLNSYKKLRNYILKTKF